MSYTLYTNGVLEKDGFYLAIDPDNPDYQAYLAWIAQGNTPASVDGAVYLAKLADDKTNLAQIKVAYADMITRLEQIQNAGSVPFTAAGFAQVVQAVKDLALYEERIMKLLRIILT